MATANNRRPRYRPMRAEKFCENILEFYKPRFMKPQGKSPPVCDPARRVVDFLRSHPRFKSTTDLDQALVEEFAGTLAGYSESTRLSTLRCFRRICGLAVEQGCSERNPFDRYPLPGRRPYSFETSRQGQMLDGEQVRSLLDYLKARSNTWIGHRTYAFTATIVYTGLRTSEALELKIADCDLDSGVIRVARRADLIYSMYPQVATIPPELAEIWADWFPRRPGEGTGAPQVPYGMRHADDGRALIPDEAEQGVLAEMRRWRGEGWSLERIARELDSRGIPTRRGRSSKWCVGSVRKFLRRAGQTGAAAAAASDGNGARGVEAVTEGDVGWLFPNVSGKGRWLIVNNRGIGPLEQLHVAGRDLGIEGLSFESLRRFHLDEARPALTLRSGGQVGPSGRIMAARLTVPAPVESDAGAPRCPIELRGENVAPQVYGVEVPILTRDEFAIMGLYSKAFASGREGYTRRDLMVLTGSSTPWRTVAIMRNKPGYEAWREVLPDRKGAKKGERFGLIDPRDGRW